MFSHTVLYNLYVYIELCDIGIEDMILGDEKMKQMGNEIYELSKSEYERMKVGATLSQNNNSPDTIRSYHIIERKDRTDLLEYTLSLYQGSKASYCLYKNVFPGYIESISGIPLSEFDKFHKEGY